MSHAAEKALTKGNTVELIFGFLLGRAFPSKGGALAFIAVPLSFAIILGVGTAAFYGASWYEAAVAVEAIESPWYAWPWNWPGVHGAKWALAALNAHVGGILGSKPATPGTDSVLQMIGIWYNNFVGATFAAVINIFVALLPLHLVALILRVGHVINRQVRS